MESMSDFKSPVGIVPPSNLKTKKPSPDKNVRRNDSSEDEHSSVEPSKETKDQKKLDDVPNEPDSTDSNVHDVKSEDKSPAVGPVMSGKDASIAAKYQKYQEMLSSMNYKVPEGAAKSPDSRYHMEVLKDGTIIGDIRFIDEKSHFVVGRIPGCDVVCENPTISRIHAILQFYDPSEGTGERENGLKDKGLYLFDLKSSHGTFLNKNQLYPKRFYRVHVGHTIRFGNSSRTFVVMGPSEDEEEESENSMTELLQKKNQREAERKEQEMRNKLMLEAEKAKKKQQEEESGCTWGMADDAEEESEHMENPFAMTDEVEIPDLDLTDPKRTLKLWFEREGLEPEYKVEDKGFGKFICRIELPLDDDTLYAEVEHQGKKREAIFQCALKACQILDHNGLLRPSHQESKRRRKLRDWEKEDYYSSDEDIYFDRTGTIEKKREKRMKLAKKFETTVETYESICKKWQELDAELNEVDKQIAKISRRKARGRSSELDPLDEFMQDLKSGKEDMNKLIARRKDMVAQKQEVEKIRERLKPAELKVDSSTPKSMPEPAPISPVKNCKNADDQKRPLEKSQAAPQESLSPKLKSNESHQSDSPCDESSTHSPNKPTSASPKGKKPSESAQHKLEFVASSENASLTKVESGKNKQGKKRAVLKAEPEDGITDEEGKTENERNLVPYDRLNNPDYAVWVPPKNQSGDGRTSLNDKLGY